MTLPDEHDGPENIDETSALDDAEWSESGPSGLDPSADPDADMALADDATDVAVAEGHGAVPLARFYGLSRSYGERRALGPLDLTLERGTVGLLGPNGAGKSTLIRLMMGVLRPTEGRLEVLGQDPATHDSRRRIGYAPEGEALFPGLSGVQAVAYAGRLVGMRPSDAFQRAHLVLDYVGLGEARYRLADGYSTGMRQRLKLAQALVHDPEVLIFDEPTEGVDPQAREDLLDLIQELAHDHGIQLLLSTHLLHDVERVATHALILRAGRVVEHGPIATLRTARHRGHQVRVVGDTEPLTRRLTEDGIAYEWRPPALRVALDDPYRVLRYVQDAGLVIRQLSPVELSLDEVFEEAITRVIDEPTAPSEEEPLTAVEEGGATA